MLLNKKPRIFRGFLHLKIFDKKILLVYYWNHKFITMLIINFKKILLWERKDL